MVAAGLAWARADGTVRVRVTGKGWVVDLEAAGGLGWSEDFQADFDGDGQRDFLIANYWPRFTPTCNGATEVTVFLFDRLGRPVPWRLDTQLVEEAGREFPFLPIRVLRPGGLVTTDCYRRVTGIYWARGGKLERRPGMARAAEAARPLTEWAGDWPSLVVTERRDAREIVMGAGYRPTVLGVWWFVGGRGGRETGGCGGGVGGRA